MDVYGFIIQNKEIFKVFYALLIVLISVLIVFKSDKLFRLSSYNGIRYFRNAFFFFGLAFFSRYLLKFLFDMEPLAYFQFIPLYMFEFFLIVGGFFLIYSLLWKRFEQFNKGSSSLFSPVTIIFYALALIITLIDLIWRFAYLLFISQIIIFLYALIISYSNYVKDKGQHKFPKFYFLAMILALIAWILNFLAATFFQWNLTAMINIYILNLLFFLLFLYGLFRAVRG